MPIGHAPASDLSIAQKTALIGAMTAAFTDGRSINNAARRGGIDLSDVFSVDRGKQDVATEALDFAVDNGQLDRLLRGLVEARPDVQIFRDVAQAIGLVVDVSLPPFLRYRTFRIKLVESPRGVVVFADCEGKHAQSNAGAVPEELMKAVPYLQTSLLQPERLTGGMRGGGLRALNGNADREQLRKLGINAFNFLFNDDVKTLFSASRREAGGASLKLRIAIDVGDAPSLADFPWELLYEGQEHLCLQPLTPIARSVEAGWSFVHSARPLQILGMVARPPLPDAVALNDRLDPDLEQKSITDALAPLEDGRVQLDWTTAGTRAALRTRLRRPPAGGRWDVFHFIGHGGFDEDEGEGFLYFEGIGESERVFASPLSWLLADPVYAPQLVVLNSCSGASATPGRPFSSIAAKLVSAGIRAVMAMQFQISETAAQEISASFYAEIAQGESLQSALTTTRQKLAGDRLAEWVTPVLYLSGEDFALITD